MNELRDETFELLERLDGIALDSQSQNFVDGLLEKREQWGDKMFVSRKQVFWLRDLAEKYG